MTTAFLLLAFIICPARVLVGLVSSPKDTSNRFPETGAFIVYGFAT